MKLPFLGKKETARESSALDALARIANDLTSLEVNTIVKPNMSARKMPPLPFALLEVAEMYKDWLGERGAELAQPLAETLSEMHLAVHRTFGGRAGGRVDPALAAEGKKIFTALADKAQDLRDREDPPLGGEDGVIARRIFDNSLSLAQIVASEGETAAGSARELLTTQSVALRKAWELGTQSVKMQTIIQLDGDVITYVQESVAANRDDPIQRIHADSVKVSLDSWRFLVETVGQMASRLLSLIVR